MQTPNEINDVSCLVKELRSINDSILENKSSVDHLDKVKLDKLNHAIDQKEAKQATNRLPLSEYNNQYNHRFDNIERNQFINYLRKGTIPHKKSVNGSIFAKDQFTATVSLTDTVYEYLNRYSIMRRLSSSVTIASDSFDSVQSSIDIGTAWSDGSQVASNTNAFVKKVIKVHDLTAQPCITQRTIDDAEMDIENYIAERLAIAFLSQEDDAFINGDGNNKPTGILHSNSNITRIDTKSSTSITLEDVLNLYYSLKDRYAPDACFLMSKSMVQAIRLLKDSNGQYLWMPGVLSGSADTLLGVPLYTSSSMPSTITSNKNLILYGDFKQGYQIVDRGDITIQRDPFSAKPLVVFFATKRVGGDVIDKNAIVALKAKA